MGRMQTQRAEALNSHEDAHAHTTAWAWYDHGHTFFAASLEAIATARQSIRLETYIFEPLGIGIQLRDALAAAAERGATVQALVDGFGSRTTPSHFWQPLHEAGGQVRVFNPLRPRRWGIRDHRKLLVCDNATAFIGGFNIAPEYEGDGVTQGWRDVALRVTGPLASALGTTFDRMYAAADFHRKTFARIRRSEEKRIVRECGCEIILSGPGRGASPLARALRRDMARARSIRIMTAYFLPSRRLRTSLARAARRGANVELLLPARSDVPLSKLATESLYGRLLRAGVKIFEYQPQMLHGKLFLVDDAVYVGSSNLDPRSLRLNYELMVCIRSHNPIAQAAQTLFNQCLLSCREITRADWRKQRDWPTRLKQRFAHFVMTRLDPWIALSQWRLLPD